MSTNNLFGYVLGYFQEQNRVTGLLPMHFVAEGLQVIEEAYRAHKQVFVIGNGGSALTASHIACDLQKTLCGHKGERRAERFKVISLTDNMGIVTAWANDVGYEVIFSEQLKNLAAAGDVLIAVSASGNSPNIMKAVETARALGMKVIGLTGLTGGALRQLADVAIHVDSHDYGIVENVHLMFGHLAAKYLVDMA